MYKTDKININDMKLPKAEIIIEDLTNLSNSKHSLINKSMRREKIFKIIYLVIIILAIITCLLISEHIGVIVTLLAVIPVAAIMIAIITYIYQNGLTDENANKLKNDILFIKKMLNDNIQNVYTVDASNEGTLLLYLTSELDKGYINLMTFKLFRGNKSAVSILGPYDANRINIVLYEDNIKILKFKKAVSNE